jgi:MFS family permease
LIAGCLAQWVSHPLTVPYLVFIALARARPRNDSMLAGLALLVVSVHLAPPSLVLFLIGGALIGAGSGAVFKGTTGIVLEASPPESRVAMTSDLLIALYVGLAVPVIGAGVALSLGASAPSTVLGFAILAGVALPSPAGRCCDPGPQRSSSPVRRPGPPQPHGRLARSCS